MRPGRVLLAVSAAVFLAAAAVLLVLPGQLDWNRYRDTIETLASAGIGRSVRIEGDVTFHLLPQPVLTASRTTVADAGDGVALSARELRLRVGLPALFAGRIDARELTLRGAELRLPWPLAQGAMAMRPPTWLSGLQARVEDGRLQLGGLALTGIEGSLSTDRDTGSLSAAGSGQFAGRTWHVTARLGRPGTDGVAPLEASLDGQGAVQDTGGSFSGQLAPDATLTGRVTGRGRDLSMLLPAPAVAWQAEGRLLASGGLAVADDLALQIGPSPARGAIALRVAPDPRLDLAVAASQLDLDAWLPVLLRGARPALPTSLDLSAEAASLGGGTLRRLRGAFDLQSGGGDAIAVRDASATLPGDAQFALSGRIVPASRPEANARSEGARFEGTGRLAAPDLRSTLRWLEPLAPGLIAALPAGALRTAQLQASISLQPGQVTLSEMQGQIDGTRVTGWTQASIAQPGTTQPGTAQPAPAQPAPPPPGTAQPTAAPAAPVGRLQVKARLAVDRLVLDPWLPNPAVLLLPASPLPPRSFDAELAVEARRATWRGVALSGVSLDAAAAPDGIALRRLEFDATGLHVGATGTLQATGRVADGRLDLSTPQLAALTAWLPEEWRRLSGLLAGPATAQLSVSGPADALALRLQAELGDLRLDAQPTLNLAARRSAGTVTLRHPGAPRLLEALGLNGVAAWLGDGSLSVVAQVDAQPGRITAESLDVSAGSLRGTGQLTVRTGSAAGGDGPLVTGKVTTEILPLPLPYARSPAPLPLGVLRGWHGAVRLEAGHVLAGMTPVLDELAANLSLAGGVLQVTDLAARLSGGVLAGSATLDAAADPPRVAVQASVSGAAITAPMLDLTIDLTAGRVQGAVELSASGYSPAALLATLGGTLRGVVRNGMATGIDLAGLGAGLAAAPAGPGRGDSALRTALSGGISAFDELVVQGQVTRGAVQLDGTVLTGPAGRVVVQGTADLPGGALDLDLAIDPSPPVGIVAGLPRVGLRLTGAADGPRRTPELAGAARWLAEQPR